MTSPRTGIAYRPDIDGLRAFAVISVILYHLSNSVLPGGFIGVDAFFVISGFVVTGSVIRTEGPSAFRDLTAFWRRRWLRIVPALLACVLVTLIAASLLIAPVPREAYNGTLRTGVAALFGLGNVYLYRIRLDYFQADQSINVFSHTWSLGIEEQFYLTFSLLIILLARVLVRGRPHRVRILIFIALTVASLGTFAVRSVSDPAANYYFLTTRLWELGLGCLLACWLPSGSAPGRTSRSLHIIQIVALAGLVGSALYDAPTSKFPAAQIIVAVFSTAALLATGAIGAPVVSRMLATRGAVAIGRISYSLYLWHWPIFTICRYTVGLQTPVTIAFALILITANSYLSYRFVEQRWRKTRQKFSTQLLPKFVTAFGVTLGAAALFQARPGIVYLGTPQAWTQDWLPSIAFPYGVAGSVRQSNCLMHEGGMVPRAIPAECISRVASASRHEVVRRKLIVVGDSHAFADWGMTAYGAEKGAYEMSTFVHDGCSANTPEIDRSESCRRYWEWVPNAVRNELGPGDAVFVAFLWFYFPGASYEPATRLVEEIAAAAGSVGARIIVEAPLPHFERPAFMCSEEWYRTDFDGCSVTREEFEHDRRNALGALRRVSNQHPNLQVWDPTNLLCSPECAEFRDGKPVFRDANHLSFLRSRALGPAFTRFFESTRD
jgi:peptidoglycan/LPS O-acetylase OafA/YrhL